MKKINWLHFTDIHYGMKNQSFLIPKFKEKLFEDLTRSYDSSSPWDIIIFSGDLVQGGKKQEFECFNTFFNELMALMNKLGCNPILLPTPGNHDLERPKNTSSVVKALKTWETDPDIQKEFWKNNNNEYRKCINKSFYNYQSWLDKNNITNDINYIKGILPGDYSLIINIRGIRLGVISLNSSYLQLDGGDYKTKLSLDIQQFNAVCQDTIKWKNETDLSFLITHNDPTWLNTESRKNYNSEINDSGFFHAHFCGHLHEPSTSVSSIGGSIDKHIRIGISLFGLEKISNNIDRKHGYSYGQITFDNDQIIEEIWPKINKIQYDGSYKIVPDLGYSVTDNNSIIFKYPNKTEFQSIESESIINTQFTNEKEKNNILEQSESDKNKINLTIASIPKFKLLNLPQYNHIRRTEQIDLESNLLKTRYSWVFTDWGMGFDGFIQSILPKIGFSGNKNLIFKIKCEDAEKYEDLEYLFKEQLDFSLQEFCHLLSSTEQESLIIFDQINPELILNSKEFSKLENLISIVLDFCSKSNIILTSRSKIKGIENFIQLKPLDIPQVKSFIVNHPDSGSELNNINIIEKLHSISDGIPMHIERFIENSIYTSINELFNTEFSEVSIGSQLNQSAPKALRDAVLFISGSKDEISQRSYSLLKALSILENGETLEAIKRLDFSKPFYPQNASQLAKLSLLDAIPLKDITEGISGSNFQEKETIKLLKVPKQVRDYVKTLINDSEYLSILNNCADCLYGPDWRTGKIKTKTPSAKIGLQVKNGIGNELKLSQLLLIQAIKTHDKHLIVRSARIALNFCNSLIKNKNYHDCALGSETICNILNETIYRKELLSAKILYSQAIRMDSNTLNETAIDSFESILIDKSFECSKEQLKSIYSGLSLACEGEKAIEYSNKLMDITPKDSGMHLQSQSVIIQNSFEGEEKLKKLIAIEKKARKNHHFVLANNIALDISAFHSKSSDEKLFQLEKIIKTKSDVLNIIYSRIRKATIQIEDGNIHLISDTDLNHLCFAYTYLYFQRNLNRFTSCHKILWKILIEKNKIESLLQLFKHSSFLWRIMDNETDENYYITELNKLNEEFNTNFSSSNHKFNFDYYELRRQNL